MFVQLVVSTLILGSVVAVPPPTVPLTSPPTIGDPTLELSTASLLSVKNPAEGENQRSAAVMTDFRCTFMEYDKLVQKFIANFNDKLQSLTDVDSGIFFEELRNLSNCCKDRSEVKQVNTTCSQHSIDEKLIEIEKSYSRSVYLLLEPLREKIRSLPGRFMLFRLAVRATDRVFNVTYPLCCEKRNETPCYPEASNAVTQILTVCVQTRRGFSIEMVRREEELQSVSNDVAELKEKAISQMQAKIKNYDCCLKGLVFSDKDNKCELPASSSSTPPSPPSLTTS